MDIFTAHIVFELQSTLTGDEFVAVKQRFLKYLADNKPESAAQLLESVSEKTN